MAWKSAFYNKYVSIGKDKKVLAMEMYVPEHDLFCISVVDNEINNTDSIFYHSLCFLSKCDLWQVRLAHLGK